MTRSGTPAQDPDVAPADPLAAVSEPVDAILDAFLSERVADLVKLDPALEAIGHEIADFVRLGGKRLRPAFVYWGYRASGAAHDDAVLQAAGAVELLHNFALIHDDVMDRSASRRGRPTVHTALATAHTAEGLRGDPEWFGIGAAVLAGDLAFVWSDRLFDDAPLPEAALARARRVFTELRTEVMAGQFLDLRLAGLGHATEADALHVALLKSGRYTVTRPLQLGAAAGAGDERLDAALVGYGDAIGLAFQLRDDVLGLFGDPDTTGKGALEDLREGKRTMLVLRAFGLCTDVEAEALGLLLGDPDLDEADADRARAIVRDCGALASVEHLIEVELEKGCGHLADVPEPAAAALGRLAELALHRAT